MTFRLLTAVAEAVVVTGVAHTAVGTAVLGHSLVTQGHVSRTRHVTQLYRKNIRFVKFKK